jgi:hypothetical protein
MNWETAYLFKVTLVKENVFKPYRYFESLTVIGNIIVEALLEFILQNKNKTAGKSGQKRVLQRPLPTQHEIVQFMFCIVYGCYDILRLPLVIKLKTCCDAVSLNK